MLKVPFPCLRVHVQTSAGSRPPLESRRPGPSGPGVKQEGLHIYVHFIYVKFMVSSDASWEKGNVATVWVLPTTHRAYTRTHKHTDTRTHPHPHMLSIYIYLSPTDLNIAFHTCVRACICSPYKTNIFGTFGSVASKHFLCEWPRFLKLRLVVSCDLESIRERASWRCKTLPMPRH